MQGSFRHRSGSGSGQTGKNISPKIKVCSCGTLHVQWVALDVELGGGINFIIRVGTFSGKEKVQHNKQNIPNVK